VPDFDYDLIESIEQLRFFAERLHAEVALGRRFGFDIETGYEGEDREKAQLHPEEGLVAGISLGACESSGTIWGRYAALNHDAGPNLDNAAAAEILWRLLITGYGVPHNASFEIRFLALWFTEHLADHPELGPEVRRRKGYIPVYSDTMIEAFVEAKFKSSKHRSSSDGIGSEAALKPLTQETFGHQMTEIFELFEAIGGKELTKKQKNSIRFNVLDLTGPHRRMIIDYVCEDAVWALAHHYKRYPEVAGNLIFQLEMDVIPCVVEMDAEGIVFDWQTMRETAVKATDFAGALREEILGDLTVMRNEAGIEGQCQINREPQHRQDCHEGAEPQARGDQENPHLARAPEAGHHLAGGLARRVQLRPGRPGASALHPDRRLGGEIRCHGPCHHDRPEGVPPGAGDRAAV
jgi:hypothetical protein